MAAGAFPNPRISAAMAAGLLLLMAAGSLFAQPPAVAPAQFDPSDVYFQGYLSVRKAEQLEAGGDFIGAQENLEKAGKLFGSVGRYYPNWKPDMVKERTAKNLESIAKLRPKSDDQKLKNRNAVAELEGGVKHPGTLKNAGQDMVPLTPPGILEVEPLAARRLSDAEAEVKRLRTQIKQAPVAPVTPVTPDADEGRNAARLRDMALQRDALQSQLRAAESTMENLRAKLAASPVESEMKALNQRIAGLGQERDAMAQALSQSRDAHSEAMGKIAAMEADLNNMRQKHADLDRDLKTERKVANEVVASQRAQLQAMDKVLAAKSAELGKANERIGTLMKELQESHDAFADLRTERDSLLQERDQMSAMLKLNADGRIQDLVQQNIGLAKTLREAQENVERLNKENNASKDDLTAATRDLAMAKRQINSLKQERQKQDTRIDELQKRLQGEDVALAAGQATANPEEVAALREIIQKLMRTQERRRQAKDLLIEAVKEMGAKDEQIEQATKLFDGEQLQLTPEEQKLVANNDVDGEFISPYARDRAKVGESMNELNRDIEVYTHTAEKSFAAGRLSSTRELFEMIVEQHPGHIPTLCKLGVVHLKQNDPAAAVDQFRRAVELDANNPYAHRMLGYSFMLLGDMASAEQSVKESASLAPDDAKSQFLLGIITDKLGRRGEAESYYKASISLDPMPSEAYFNLALLCSRDKRLDAARTFYQQALERGALPDPTLEQRLAQP